MGIRSPNPLSSSAPDRHARRTIGDALRDLMTPKRLGEVLLAIAAGVDPFASERKRNPDGVPQLGSTEIDWTHRMAALKMFAEYAHGKPAQSVVVQAEIDQRIALEQRVEVGPVDFRSMPPEVRAAMRVVAAGVLGRALPPQSDPTASAKHVGVVDAASVEVRGEQPLVGAGSAQGERTGVLGEAADVELKPMPASLALVVQPIEDVDVRLGDDTIPDQVRDGARDEGRAEGDQGGSPGVAWVEFVGSSNLARCRLVGGVCEVVFRRGDGEDGPTYRYANVTPAMVEEWRAAPSAGAWFARKIRARPLQYPVVGRPEPVTRGPLVVG